MARKRTEPTRAADPVLKSDRPAIPPSLSIANRYISVGGRLPNYGFEHVSDDLTSVASFILWHDDEHLQGGVTAGDAFAALCRLIDIPAAKIRTIVGPEGARRK